jgi:protein-disulfide isomerase
MTTLPGRAMRDLRLLARTPTALILALVLIGGSAAAIALFPKEPSSDVEPQKNIPPLTGQQRAEVEAWWKVQPKVDLPVPASPGVKVQIVTFSDYQCPACRAAHDSLRRVVGRYDQSAVELTLKHYPLEGECNPAAARGNHYAACEAAAAYVMARGTGFQQKLDDWLFANQATLTPATVRQAAKDVAGIADFDTRYARALQEVRADADLGAKLNVEATPTIYLNRRMIAGKSSGLPPDQYLDTLIDIELKAAR